MPNPVTSEASADEGRRLGFYGKLPMRGDFLSRGLPHDFITPWDEWMQHAIAASRTQLGEGWLPVYLSAPIWRFVITAGVCGAAPALGIMMPSVDRVGRYFPLALVYRTAACAAPLGLMESAELWFAALEQLALGVLDDAADLEAFEQAITDFEPPPEVDGAGAGIHPEGPALVARASGDGAIREAAPILLDGLLAGLRERWTLWSTSGSEAVEPCLVAATGLPPPDGFAALLDGQWERWGWKTWKTSIDDTEVTTIEQPHAILWRSAALTHVRAGPAGQ